MAFGEHRGNHWLLIPAFGITLMLAAHFNALPAWLGSQERMLGYGFGITLVGIVCAGLFGHIVWLVPFALLLASPFMVLFWIQEKCTEWRRKNRAANVQTPVADAPCDAPKSRSPRF